MKKDEEPRVVDLGRYRQAAERARPKPAPKPDRPKGGGQSLLGPNRHARIILILVIVAALALSLGPQLLG